MSYSPKHIRIHSIESFGTHDGPGIRMVVFTQGCQFRCLYCANPDTWDTEGGHDMPIDEIVAKAVRMKSYFGKYGGVTVSGGEPTLQRVALLELFRKLHAEGINTALDSNGRILNDETKALLEETDYLLLDVKHIDDTIHHQLTGVSNKPTLDLAAYRESTGKTMWLRYVLVPEWTDQEEHLHAWGKYFSNYTTVEKVEIQPYHRLGTHKWKALNLPYALAATPNPDKALLDKTASIFRTYFRKVIIN